MVDLAKGGKDVNAVAADALALAATSTPLIGLLLSTFGKWTLDVMQTPMREFMEEGLENDKKELDKMKFKKISKFRQELSEYTFLRDIYKFESISYQSMQGLLNGTIKKWKDLEYANEEVTLLYKYVEKEDIFIIDTFFINTEKE